MKLSSSFLNKLLPLLKVELLAEDLADDLSATSYLGISSLHDQLEETLKKLASSPKTRIEAINTATNPKCGVSNRHSFLGLDLKY